MYLMDPERGPRRRALLRDQFVSAATDLGNVVEPTLDDLSNRTGGLVYEARGRIFEGEVTDHVLEQRVRAEMGRYVSHPGSLTVTASNGVVVLQGPVLKHEVEALMTAVATVPGVEEVINDMDEHKTRGDVPGLQGGDVPPAKQPEVWPPAKRFLVGGSGSLLTAVGLKEGGLLGSLFSALGLAAVVRAVTDIQAKRLVGVDAGHRSVDVQKTINVNAPVEEVFRLWDNFENFPRFMGYVEEVRDLGNGRSHWVVKGPGPTTVSWDAAVTKRVPNEVIAWASGEATPVPNAGIVHFTPNQEGGTQIHIKMSYNPPVGAAGHAVADLLGYDPETMMHEDLARFKSLIEAGKTTANGQTVTREEL